MRPGRDWRAEEIAAAVEQGPHKSILEEDAVAQLHEEVAEKVQSGQTRLCPWGEVQQRPPKRLKVSPVAMVPHKSRRFRCILDLSFSLSLNDGRRVPSVNEATEKTAPAGAVDQIGHALARIVHALAELSDNEVAFMAKWDIQDGF